MQGRHILNHWFRVPALFIALCFALSFYGCGEGLPKGVKESAKQIPELIKSSTAGVDTAEAKYKTLAASDRFSAVKKFTDAENLAANFKGAKQDLSRAQQIWDNELAGLVKKNNPADVPKVQQQIHRIKKILSEAKKRSNYPEQRALALIDARSNPEKHLNEAVKNAGFINRTVDEIKTGVIDKALKDFDGNAEKINTRFAPFAKLKRESTDHLTTIKSEYDKYTGSTDVNWSAFTDSAAALALNVATLNREKPVLENEIKQLYKSYTKVLKDMKVGYTLIIKRESWDESSDYYNPSFTMFERQVSAQTYEALTAENVDSIADVVLTYSGPRVSSRVEPFWQSLQINPKERWPSRYHNAASFWVEDDRTDYYHKYILENNGETTETQWEKVDESLYEEHIEHLGMAILAKPYGEFEKDRMTQAAPPGMAYVGNPQYGEWQERENGDRFWSWYGRYAFFSTLFFYPPYHYGYRSWSGWHSNYRYKKPYFGKTKQGFQQFGTNGSFVRKSPTFQNTSFAKSGGFKSQAASVRGASVRGGGPKGKGK